jgi:uncharacterized membrane protein YphA (DoxX/SURF4 family)
VLQRAGAGVDKLARTMTTSSWGLRKRIACRFAFLLVLLLALPFPVDLIPKMGWLDDGWGEQWTWGVSLLARLFGIPNPPSTFNGSGDRTYDYLALLLIALVATLGTVVWSIIDRRRASYPRLATATWVLVRYSVAYAMLGYGFAKILRSQFDDLWPSQLTESVGDMSPMGLLWTFMGYSAPYTVFAGLLEAIGGVLLLWRRTTTVGALVAAAVMFNVAMLNLCYDVPVKLYSLQLFIMALAIAAPRARAVLAVLLGGAAPEVPARARMSLRSERARLIVKLAILALMAWRVYGTMSEQAGGDARKHELQDAWVVDSFMIDGVEGTATDPLRWQKLAFNPGSIAIMPIVGDREIFGLKVDADNREITVRVRDPKNKDAKLDPEIWKYRRPTPDHLEIDGVHHGKRFHAAAHLAPAPLLLTRGFRWINEAPFNR